MDDLRQGGVVETRPPSTEFACHDHDEMIGRPKTAMISETFVDSTLKYCHLVRMKNLARCMHNRPSERACYKLRTWS